MTSHDVTTWRHNMTSQHDVTPSPTRCFNDLIEYLLYSDDVFCTTDYLLHPHFNNLAMPLYFDSLYNLIFSLEQVHELNITSGYRIKHTFLTRDSDSWFWLANAKSWLWLLSARHNRVDDIALRHLPEEQPQVPAQSRKFRNVTVARVPQTPVLRNSFL